MLIRVSAVSKALTSAACGSAHSAQRSSVSALSLTSRAYVRLPSQPTPRHDDDDHHHHSQHTHTLSARPCACPRACARGSGAARPPLRLRSCPEGDLALAWHGWHRRRRRLSNRHGGGVGCEALQRSVRRPKRRAQPWLHEHERPLQSVERVARRWRRQTTWPDGGTVAVGMGGPDACCSSGGGWPAKMGTRVVNQAFAFGMPWTARRLGALTLPYLTTCARSRDSVGRATKPC